MLRETCHFIKLSRFHTQGHPWKSGPPPSQGEELCIWRLFLLLIQLSPATRPFISLLITPGFEKEARPGQGQILQFPPLSGRSQGHKSHIL